MEESFEGARLEEINISLGTLADVIENSQPQTDKAFEIFKAIVVQIEPFLNKENSESVSRKLLEAADFSWLAAETFEVRKKANDIEKNTHLPGLSKESESD